MKRFRPARKAFLRLTSFLVIAITIGVLATRAVQTEDKPSPPPQPANGPGGANHAHGQVVARMYGTGPTRYWIFEPADPVPQSAPVILFNHGWLAMEPKYYGAWIDHIVRRGNIVIYPVYQQSIRSPMSSFTPNAAEGIRSAIERLQTEPGHVRPRLDMLAAVGHSMGALITANLGVEWKDLGIPQPRALMCVEPGKTSANSGSVQLDDLSLIYKDTLLLAIAGDRDRIVKDSDAKRIFKESRSILSANKNYILMVSDEHGYPQMIASHLAPLAFNDEYSDRTAGGPLLQWFGERMEKRRLKAKNDPDDPTNARINGIDVLDYYGTWKLFDALTDAAFYGHNREYALGNTPQQRFMGKWSDGTPVKELQVTTVP